MSTVDITEPITVAGWDKQKNAMAKDKAVASKLQGESGKLAEALKNLAKSHAAVNLADYDAKGLATAAAAEAALKKLEAAQKDEIKTLLGHAKLATAAADTFAAAAEKLRKTLKGDSEKVAVAAMTGATKASQAADKLFAELTAAVEAAHGALSTLSAKLKGGEKKPGVAPVNPKAAADAKTIGALIKKAIAALKSPKGSPVPVKFFVLQQEKKVRVYLGPKPDAAFAKLKTQFDPKAKLRKIRDVKGTVIWEKASLTFVSDILKGALAKPIQIAIREQTKVSVKVRVKKSDGSVEEAENVPDLTDDQLKVDAADEAAMQAELKEVAKRFAGMKAAIEAALKGPNGAKIKPLYASLTGNLKGQKFADATDDLDEIEAILEPGEEDTDDAEDKGAPANVPAGKAFQAKFAALRSKIDAAVAAGGAAAKQIKDMASAAEQLAKNGAADGVAKANDYLNRIEKMLGDAAAKAAGGADVSVDKLKIAQDDWIKARDTAVKEITVLSKAIVAAFAKETAQAPKVKEAVAKLGKLQSQLKSGLDKDLSAAVSTTDPAKRAQLATKAKASLKSVMTFVETDDLMKNLDNNEIIKTMSVVAPMKSSLQAIEAALG